MTNELRIRQNVTLERFEHEGQRYVALKCPHLLAEPLVLIEDVMPLLALFDGKNSEEQIKEKFKTVGLPDKIYPELKMLLNNHLLFENEAFFCKWNDFKATFSATDLRKPHLAGKAYIDDKNLLKDEICTYLSVGGEKFRDADIVIKELPLAIIAPHIDYGRGGNNYGISYNRLSEVSLTEPPVVFVFGICHQMHTMLFHLTKKDFETPLGIVKTERETVESIAGGFKESSICFIEEPVHIFEHSIELQLPFLQTIWGNNFSIVPILFGSFNSFITNTNSAAESEDLETFIKSTARTIQTLKKPWTVVLSVDMSHMGQAFGDPYLIDQSKTADINLLDSGYIDSLTSAGALMNRMIESQNRTKICGYPAIYSFLRIMEESGINNSLITYDYSYSLSRDQSTFVSFQSGSYEPCVSSVWVQGN